MLAAATLVKLIAEIALFALMGQWVLGLLAGAARERNFFYRVFVGVARPWVSATRWLSPRWVADRHIPRLTFFFITILWVAATAAKVGICLRIGVTLCR